MIERVWYTCDTCGRPDSDFGIEIISCSECGDDTCNYCAKEYDWEHSIAICPNH